jgi:hypothetical protein
MGAQLLTLTNTMPHVSGSRVTYAMVEYCISQKFFSTAVKAVKLHQVCSAN